MPFSGSAPTKTFSRTDGTRTGAQTWQQAKAAPVKIRADAHDTHDQDIADAISALWLRNGDNQPTADLPLNSFKFTGVGVATARTNFLGASQAQDSTVVYAGTSTGTDTIAATLTPAITAYVTGQRYHFKAGGTNTGAATANFNTVGAASIKKGAAGATALGAGDITLGGIYSVIYDGTNFQLENPGLGQNISAFMATVLDDATAGAALTTLGVSAFVQTILDDANAAAALTTLGISAFVQTLLDDATAAVARGTLGAILADAVFPGALVAIIEDQKAQNTAGGTFTSGADQTRVLNTLVYSRNSAVSIASNQFTLPAGSWDIEWFAPAYAVDESQSWLHDITAGAVAKRGSTTFGSSADGVVTFSHGLARVTPAGSNFYEIRHRCLSTFATQGFGRQANLGTETYTRVVIRAA
jgi:hypothetical protein